FDLPGTINNTSVISLLAEMNYVFCPIIADNVVMKSSIIFTERFLKKMPGIKGCYLMWNMVDRREKSEVYDMWAKILDDLSVPVLQTQMPNLLRFRKEQGDKKKGVFRSTVFPPDKSLMKGSNVDLLVDEVLSIISK
ncbi:MAG: ParA family protein, partial [Prevotella sp.]|nr:ParA family protein [Prevotella sp.]